jgi:DNA-binding response OmpR family regulator
MAMGFSQKLMKREKVRALGIENFLAKPFTIDKLIAKLDGVLESMLQRVQKHHGASGRPSTETE